MKRPQLNESELNYLQEAFSDLINFESDDPEAPIDPFSYKYMDGDGCLHYAVARGDFKAIKLLLKGGADINEKGDMESTPLHYARAKNNQVMIEFLIENGAEQGLKNWFGKLS